LRQALDTRSKYSNLTNDTQRDKNEGRKGKQANTRILSARKKSDRVSVVKHSVV